MKHHVVDIRDYEKLKKVFLLEQPEIVFHLAAQPIVRLSYEEPLSTISTNVLGTTHVMDIVREVKTVKSVVIITTDKVYKDNNWSYPYREIDPLGGYDPYSSSKAAADLVTQSYIQSFFNPKDFGVTHSTNVTIARAGNVIGGGDWAPNRLVPDIIRAVYEQDKPVEIRYPNAIRPWEHVLEPLSGYLQLGKSLYEGNVSHSRAWNFGPNDDSFATVEELVQKALLLLEKGTLLIKADESKHETKILKLDITEAKTLLGWSPNLNFEENLEYTFSWYKNYYEKQVDVIDFTDSQINSFFKKI